MRHGSYLSNSPSALSLCLRAKGEAMQFSRLEEEGTKDHIPDLIPGPLPDRNGDPFCVLYWTW